MENYNHEATKFNNLMFSLTDIYYEGKYDHDNEARNYVADDIEGFLNDKELVRAIFGRKQLNVIPVLEKHVSDLRSGEDTVESEHIGSVFEKVYKLFLDQLVLVSTRDISNLERELLLIKEGKSSKMAGHIERDIITAKQNFVTILSRKALADNLRSLC